MPAKRQVWDHGTVFGYDKRGCRCDACRLARYDYDQQRYTRIADLRKEQVGVWRDANREKVRGYTRAQYQRDPEKAKEWKRTTEEKLLAADPDYRRKLQKRYQQTEKGRLKNLRAAHKRRGVVTDAWTAEYMEILIKDLCSYCGGPGGTVDHIVPVSKSGTSEWENLTAACLSCNSSKHTSDLLGFLSRKVSL